MEEFGCVDPARQGAVDALGTFNTYRWDLDLIVDRYGNQIRINYQRTVTSGSNVRDAVISSIEYDDPSCHTTTFTNASAQCASWHPQVRLVFDASMKPAHLTNTTGCQNWTSTAYRCDDPVDLTSSQGLGIAKAINTYVLNDVQVLVNGHTLRQYIFSYDQGGPQTRVDQLSGSSESIAGYLNLTKIQQLGTDVNGLSAPVTTMSYINNTSVQQHYIDKLFGSNTKSPCPSAIPRFNSTQCVLWEQSYNSSYLSSIDNGMGWHATFSWKEAHNNTHGAVGSDPFTCDAPGAQTPTSLCGSADDENWSRIVLVGRTEVTNGVSSTWGYQYTVNGLSAQQCSDCQHGYTWGNQNDNDYTDYYNGQFTSFAQAQVTNPDKSYQIDYFASTTGWGEANSSIHCYTKYACHPAPYWNEDPGAAGKLNQEEDYSASGQLMQVTSNTYAMNCPPLGVAGSKNAVGGTVDPGSGYLFSELDHNNPVVVCDPRVTQTDSYQVDGVTGISGYKSDARVVHKTVTTSYDGDDQGVAAYDYGNVNRVDTTGNDVGGQQFVQTTSYFPDNNVNGNVYLTDLPAFVQNRDASGTIDGCQVYVYGGNPSPPHAPVVPAVTLQAGFVDATNCGGTASATLHSYDSSGNPITATDPDGHQGCTSGSGQYSACASYDSFDTHLTRALNAKNQAVSYRYDLSQASSGYGQWLMSTTDANGQTTTFTYDALGRLTSEIKPGDTQSQPTVSYTYINTCRVGTTSPCLELDTTTRVTSGSNTTTTTRAWYDGMGRVVETQAPGPNEFSKLPATGSLLVSYTLYDTMGRATTTSLPYAIAATATTGYANPDLTQARTVTTYDALGRATSSTSYGTGSLILTESTTSYTVGQGLTSFSVDKDTAFERTITQDAYGHQSIAYTDALGRERYVQVYTGIGNPYGVVRTTQYNRDEAGNVTSVVTYDATSAGLARTTATFNGLKQRTGYNDSDLGSCGNTPLPPSCSSSSDTAWKYTYDADGNVLSQTDPRNVTTYTSYDALDRPLCIGTASAQVNPCGSSAYATYFYDSYDNSSNPGVTFPSACTAPGGTSAPVGKAIVETFSNAAGSGWRCYGYDTRGETVANALSVTADGQTTTQNTSMTYNDVGDVTSLTYPDGEVLSSNYDSKGYLRSTYFGTTSSTDPVSFLVGQVSYTNTGQLAGLAIGGSAAKTSVPTNSVFSTTMGYDGIQRPVSSSATLTGASTPFWSLTRTLDNDGNVLQLSTTLPTTSGGSLTDNQSFCYDALGRLTWAGNSGTPTGGDHCGSTPGGSTTTAYAQAYSYDAIDRLIQGGAGTLSYNDPSHVHAATNLSTVPNQYASYDAMGNMTCRTTDTTGSQSCAAGTQTGATMSYDNVGRLVSWTAPTGLGENDQYLYDNEGNRVLTRSSTTTNGTTTSSDTITFDNLTEVDIAAGVTTVTNYYNVSGQRVAMRKGAILSYLVPDFLGSDSVALNSDGSVQAVQLFAPYGQVRYNDQIMPTDYSFAGQRLDQRSGLLYDNARYYDPVSGRFTRADTVQTNTMGQDPYAYVGDSPETKTDPTGTMHICSDEGDCNEGGGGSPPPPSSPPPPPPPPTPTPDPQPGAPSVTQVVSALSRSLG